MENKITTFSNEEFGNVRTMMIDGDPWFAGKDVALALRYTNPQKAIRDHVDEEDRTVNDSFTVHGTPITLINESGLYALIMSSKLPSAKIFKRWVTSEVLPTIRKHGMYITNPLLGEIVKDPSILRNMVKNYLAATAQAEMLAAEVENMRPKAEFFDAFVSPTDCTNIRTTAKELQSPERQFCKFLVDARFLFRCPAGNLMPYNKLMNRKLFIVRDYYADNGHKGSYTLITPQGKNMFRMMLCEM
ncbi:MAG: phage antirepressor KilAC domain-containing protein [Clostridia bacterium]|nr:phage antirepressor KilAC domain-containing protein [Clostridia bacterium]